MTSLRSALLQREKRIDSPLVRYNDSGQPVCKLCNVTLKSSSLWTPHLVSRGHKEAAEQLKVRAAAARAGANVEGPSTTSRKQRQVEQLLQRQKAEDAAAHKGTAVASTAPVGTAAGKQQSQQQSQSVLPTDFFDGGGKAEAEKSGQPAGKKQRMLPPQAERRPTAGASTGAGEAPPQGLPPEGFFDSKVADHKARGVELVKVDLKAEMKEYEKEIKGDLEEVDNRRWEEEAEAADERAEADAFLQRRLRERVEKLKEEVAQQEAAAFEGRLKEERADEGQRNSTKGDLGLLLGYQNDDDQEDDDEEEGDEEEKGEDEDEEGNSKVDGYISWRSKEFANF
eukprot:TRINITY_DN16045_c0_g2_i1.p1 TRINITY_DN16045_c0_g2~~TRINITY_DN16045_c0_g2_i1.p1  ORF type:complete len:340 (+),score=119.04 TRINITY_DN16045_c0_g2_i1:289-1308(+)